MTKGRRAKRLELSWDEIAILAHGMSFATQTVKAATDSITEEYGLGPRGAWILRLIESRSVVYPLDVTNVFQIGRSLITAELTRLAEAGLIAYCKPIGDRRRIELHLTPLGQQVAARVREELSKVILDRLSSFSRDDVLMCSRILHEFIFGESVGARPLSVSRPSKVEHRPEGMGFEPTASATTHLVGYRRSRR
jgi:DNA-binding MarR family transcriptional regulator